MLIEKTIIELSKMLKSGETTSVEIVKAYLDRIAKIDKEINSYISVTDSLALNLAEESDKRRSEGKELSEYDGIPIAIKDNIHVKGEKTTCASKILENFVSPYDSGSYENMKSVGFIVIGKTNLDEFAMGSSTESSFFGITKNPYDKSRVPGGSSGGSAAAVSANLAPASLGSDTGGSIRQPAAFCGVVGIKPTYGRVSRFGLTAFASSLDQIGTFANTVDDAAALLSVISGYDKRDSTSIDAEIDFAPESLSSDMAGKTIGVPDEYFQGISDDVNSAVKKQIENLKNAGATIVPISLKLTEYAIPIYYLIATAEASSNLARYDGVRYGTRSENVTNLSELYENSRSEGFGKEVKRRIILGTYSLSSGYYDAYYNQALKGRALIIEDFKEAFSKVDAIVTPVTTTTAFKIGEMVSDPLEMYMSDILTISANLAGIPGISVPVGLDKTGLPIGMQVLGKLFDEKTILNVAKAIEENCESNSPKL